MKAAIPILALAMALGCATRPTTYDALRGAEISLKGVDLSLERSAERWSDLADAAIERCDSAAPEKREECLGAIAESGRAAALAEAIQSMYDRMAADLAAAKAAAKELEALHQRAEEEAGE